MRDYFIRRLLLIPPTLLGISILVFAITRLAPGGPLEQAMMQMQQVSEDGGGGLNSGSDQALSEDQLIKKVDTLIADVLPLLDRPKDPPKTITQTAKVVNED